MTPSEGEPRLSVIIPALDEGAALPHLLSDLERLDVRSLEIIVADGGSTDATRDVALGAGAIVIGADRGRGRQLRAGAMVARAPLLCFLHADVRLPDHSLRTLERLAMGDQWPHAAHAFRLSIDAPGRSYRVVEAGANLRSRLLSLPYGDQGLIVSREAYERAGGFAPVPLMEDVMLVRELRRALPIVLLPAAIRVSARRWERDGVWRRSARNLVLLIRWLAGASPERLAALYQGPRQPR